MQLDSYYDICYDVTGAAAGSYNYMISKQSYLLPNPGVYHFARQILKYVWMHASFTCA